MCVARDEPSVRGVCGQENGVAIRQVVHHAVDDLLQLSSKGTWVTIHMKMHGNPRQKLQGVVEASSEKHSHLVLFSIVYHFRRSRTCAMN